MNHKDLKLRVKDLKLKNIAIGDIRNVFFLSTLATFTEDGLLSVSECNTILDYYFKEYERL